MKRFAETSIIVLSSAGGGLAAALVEILTYSPGTLSGQNTGVRLLTFAFLVAAYVVFGVMVGLLSWIILRLLPSKSPLRSDGRFGAYVAFAMGLFSGLWYYVLVRTVFHVSGYGTGTRTVVSLAAISLTTIIVYGWLTRLVYVHILSLMGGLLRGLFVAIGVLAVVDVAWVAYHYARYEESLESAELQGYKEVSDRVPPDIILITIDTLRPDRLGCYGAADIRTPGIDGLAGESVVFDNCYATSPWTLPSFLSLFTGLYPDVVAAPTKASPARQLPTLQGILKESGYYTAGVLINPYLSRGFRMNAGFDYFNNLDEPPSDLFAFLQNTSLEEFYHRVILGPTPLNGRPVAEQAVKFIRKNRDRKLFLWVHFLDPHYPYGGPHVETLPFDDPTEFGYDRGDMVIFDQDVQLRKMQGRPGDNDIRMIRYLYDRDVEFVDGLVGQVIQALKEAGKYDRSLVVLTSDHGEEFWEHGGWEHGHHLHRELLHIPLLVKLPRGQGAGRRESQTVSLVDVPTSILRFLGIDAPAYWQGRSFLEAGGGISEGSDSTMAYATGVMYGPSRLAFINGNTNIIVTPDKKEVDFFGESDSLFFRQGIPKRFEEERRLFEELRLFSLANSELRMQLRQQEAGTKPQLSAMEQERLQALGYIR